MTVPSARLRLSGEDRALVARALRRLYEDPASEEEADRITALVRRVDGGHPSASPETIERLRAQLVDPNPENARVARSQLRALGLYSRPENSFD